MRTISLTGAFTILLFGLFLLTGCDTSINSPSMQSMTQLSLLSMDPISDIDGYIITLEDVSYDNGITTFIWSVLNPNPTNPNNGGLHDVSHFNIAFGACVIISDIVSASYRFGDGDWSELEEIPDYKNDPSTSDCFLGDIFKFDIGTDGDEKTYYKLELNGKYGVEESTAVIKAGNACFIGTIAGVGCPMDTPEKKKETAWGEGERFRNPGNWAMYFMLPEDESEVTVDLIAGQHYIVGTVTVNRNDGTVTYSVDENVFITETHLAVSDSVAGLPQNRAGNPQVGLFEFKSEHEYDDEVTSVTHEVSFDDGDYYIAAHAVVWVPEK